MPATLSAPLPTRVTERLPERTLVTVATYNELENLPDPAAVANRLASLVQSLEEEFRLVILDGGRTTDRAAAPLARLCDATYFVVHLGDTESSQAQRALRDFRATGARLLGCIATS